MALFSRYLSQNTPKGFVMRKSRHSVCSCHRTANELLRGRKGICLSVFVLLTLCAFAFLGMFLLCVLILQALGLENASLACTLLVLGGILLPCLFLAPLWEGVFAFFLRLSRTQTPRFSEIFSFYCSFKRYRYALLRFVCRLLRRLFFLFAFLLVAGLGKAVGEYLVFTGDLTRASLVFGGTLFFLLLLLIMGVRFAYRPYLMGAAFFSVPSFSHRSARSVSAAGMRHMYGKVILLDLSFAPILLFSLLFLGIPLVFFLPRYLAARAEMCFALLSLEPI